MTKKISQGKFVRMLINKSGVSKDEDFGKILGVTKSAVGLWKNEKSPIPIEKFLTAFGHETLDWIKQEYGLEDKKSDQESDDVLKAEAKKIQLLIDRGMIKLPTVNTLTILKTTSEDCCTCEDCIEVSHYVHQVAAGFPADSTSPAEKISLPKILVKHPDDTYAVTVSGDSMKRACIEEGDILIVDKAMEPANKSIVIASINGEQTVKRLQIKKGAVSLMPENHKYPEIAITPEMDFRTLGVVMWVIRKTG
jgi:DNA polymerase V